jgi:hypothetical protein
MYTVHLDNLGMIHNFQWIAAIETIEIKKAEPFLTLPLFIFAGDYRALHGEYQSESLLNR